MRKLPPRTALRARSTTAPMAAAAVAGTLRCSITGRAVRRLQQVAQRLDRGPGLGQPGLQPVQVRGDKGVAGRRVRCGQHCLDVGDRHLQVAQPPDDLRGRDLPGRVIPVARARVDRGRLEQPHLVVVAQCLDAEVSRAGEVAHREPCCHQAIANPPVAGESNAGSAVDPPSAGAPRVESSAQSTPKEPT